MPELLIRVSYVDKSDKRWIGQDYGLEERITDLSKIEESVDHMLLMLKKDYNARHQGEDSRWP